MRILYAEDEEITRKNYAKFLRRYFSEVYEAKDGKEALNIYEKKRPEVLLLDIDMPYIDGLEVAKEVRKGDENCKIIMLTAIKDVDKLIMATELNLTKYLPKPITREKLKEAINIAISQLNMSEKIYLADKLFWNINSKELFFDDRVLKLTKFEREFFSLLISHKSRIFSNEEIMEYIWRDSDLSSDSRLKDLVKRVRKKLPYNIIENIYSVGYKLSL